MRCPICEKILDVAHWSPEAGLIWARKSAPANDEPPNARGGPPKKTKPPGQVNGDAAQPIVITQTSGQPGNPPPKPPKDKPAAWRCLDCGFGVYAQQHRLDHRATAAG